VGGTNAFGKYIFEGMEEKKIYVTSIPMKQVNFKCCPCPTIHRSTRKTKNEEKTL